MSNERILERKRLAMLNYPHSKRRVRDVLGKLIQHPEFSDSQIASCVRMFTNDVARIRRNFKIPPLSEHSICAMPENAAMWDEWCKQDDEKLDKGVCEINLHGDEYERYLIIRRYKSRKKNYLHPRGKEKENVHTDSTECAYWADGQS